MKAVKFKKYLYLFIGLVIMGFVAYKFILYTPYPINHQKRNFIDKSIDFFSFGWHLTKGSIYEEYIKDSKKAQKEFARAAWYREIYLKNKFGLEDNKPHALLELYKKLVLSSIQEQIYVDILKEGNQDLSFYQEAGKTLMERKNWKMAVDAYKKVINEGQSNEMDYYCLGLSYLNWGRLEKARDCFIKAVEIQPDFADAYYRLGLIAEKKKEWSKAEEFYEKALRILPNHLNSLKSLSKIYNKIT